MSDRNITDEDKARAAILLKAWNAEKSARADRGQKMTQAMMAEFAGWSDQSAVSQYLNGYIALNVQAIIAFGKFLGTLPDELKRYGAELLNLSYPKKDIDILEIREEHPILEIGPDITKAVRCPVIGDAELGLDGFFVDQQYPVGQGEGFIVHPTSDPNAYTLRVRGDSMQPAIESGWLVVIEPNCELQVGEYVLVKMKDGRCTVKKLLWHKRGEYALLAVNGNERISIKESDVEFVHYVGGVYPPSKWRL